MKALVVTVWQWICLAFSNLFPPRFGGVDQGRWRMTAQDPTSPMNIFLPQPRKNRFWRDWGCLICMLMVIIVLTVVCLGVLLWFDLL